MDFSGNDAILAASKVDPMLQRLAEAGREYSKAHKLASGLSDHSFIDAVAAGTMSNKLDRAAMGLPPSTALDDVLEQDRIWRQRAGIDDTIAPILKALETTNAMSRSIADEMRANERLFDEAHFLPPLPPMPVNPIVETNQLLGELTDEIGRVTELSSKQIEIQTAQVDLIGQLLATIAEGSAAQDASLALAKRNMWIAIIAAIISSAIGIATLILG